MKENQEDPRGDATPQNGAASRTLVIVALVVAVVAAIAAIIAVWHNAKTQARLDDIVKANSLKESAATESTTKEASASSPSHSPVTPPKTETTNTLTGN